jgi:dynein heavy chain
VRADPSTPQAILGQHLAQLNREDVTQAFGGSLTDVTLQLYSSLQERLPPTPSRYVYTFNLRDLSRVYEGLLRSTGDTIGAPADFLRLWRNEVCVGACGSA